MYATVVGLNNGGTMNTNAKGRREAIILSAILVAVVLITSIQISAGQGSFAGEEAGAVADVAAGTDAEAGAGVTAGTDSAQAQNAAAPGQGNAAAGTSGTGIEAERVSTSHSAVKATPPAVESIELDATELLFGKKGAKLTLGVTVKPKRADTSGIKYRSNDTSVATVNSKGVVKAKGWGTCTVSARVGGKKARVKVTVAKKWVALTFDDGPGSYTNKLLKAMKKRGVRATFFVVGQMAKSRKDILKKTVKYGNEIGNHTYAHNGSAGALMNGLSKTDSIVKSATGSKTTIMRPPGGAINSVTYRCGKPIIIWSVDPKDWRDRNANTVYSRVMNSTKSGSIVLLHDIHKTSVTAAIRIMDALKDKGYAFVTVSEMLKAEKAGKVYYKGSKKVRTMKLKY
jgi:peptidoglycan/xylan/chitin deacetylase (PgdA/CDA1 family)